MAKNKYRGVKFHLEQSDTGSIPVGGWWWQIPSISRTGVEKSRGEAFEAIATAIDAPILLKIGDEPNINPNEWISTDKIRTCCWLRTNPVEENQAMGIVSQWDGKTYVPLFDGRRIETLIFNRNGIPAIYLRADDEIRAYVAGQKETPC